MSFKKHFLIALWERSNNVKRMFHFRTFCFNIFSPALHVRIGLYTNSLLTNTHSNSQDPLPSCSAWLHISPLRRFLNTSCTPIRKKKLKKKKFCTIYPVRLSITVALAAPSWAQRQRSVASHLSKRPRRLRMAVSGEDGLSSGRRGWTKALCKLAANLWRNTGAPGSQVPLLLFSSVDYD